MTLAYGAWEAAPGPYVTVKSERADPELATAMAGVPGRGPEAGMARAIDAERDRLAASTGVDEDETGRTAAVLARGTARGHRLGRQARDRVGGAAGPPSGPHRRGHGDDHRPRRRPGAGTAVPGQRPAAAV